MVAAHPTHRRPLRDRRPWISWYTGEGYGPFVAYNFVSATGDYAGPTQSMNLLPSHELLATPGNERLLYIGGDAVTRGIYEYTLGSGAIRQLLAGPYRCPERSIAPARVLRKLRVMERENQPCPMAYRRTRGVNVVKCIDALRGTLDTVSRTDELHGQIVPGDDTTFIVGRMLQIRRPIAVCSDGASRSQ